MKLRRIELENFKAFERLTVVFSDTTFVVGPNNAGKSTLLSAIKLGAGLLRQASRMVPTRNGEYRGNSFLAYGLDGERFGLVEENLRHEFRNQETSARLVFDNGNQLTAVWPSDANPDDDSDEASSPFFYLEVEGRSQPRRAIDVRAAFPTIGVVPMLSPIERTEELLQPETVGRNIGGRLSSRHFRNQLWLLNPEQYIEYLAFVSRWCPEVDLSPVTRRASASGLQLDLFYQEPGRRSPKEICWAGDGMQVWLQILLYLYRYQSHQIVVLDEPDIYLHADLQRRLVQVLEELDGQTVTASHSPEVLGEAQTENVVWVDKSRRRAVRGSEALGRSADAVGSQFNVRMARALRSKVVLFVEGNDMKILRGLAKASGSNRIADEIGLAVVPIDGFSNRNVIAPFKVLVDEFLEGTVTGFVILDRDYQGADMARAISNKFRDIGIGCHVWGRKELESYLLVPSLLARAAALPTSKISMYLSEIMESLRGRVFARALSKAEEEFAAPNMHRVNIIEAFEPAFALRWSNLDERLAMVPPKEVLSMLNEKIVEQGGTAVSIPRLSRMIRKDEVDAEVVDLFARIENLLDSERISTV